MEVTTHIDNITKIFQKQIYICKKMSKSYNKLNSKVTKKQLFKFARLRKDFNLSQNELKTLLNSN